ncbi:regulatory protein, luxR family [Mycetocola miduiensis]|uniref:Regulatory protein, luxR family n=2 Tax=Mycetocola miduiensis TaxID=995034 RepID=A0A1I5ADY9_9MICO|nr:regulatory protein, luxR family [Mycetocola miduiensis]
MGIPGVGEIHPGMHVCVIYAGPEERDRLLVPFMQEGLRHGDKCVCLIDDVEPASMRQRAYEPASPGDARRSGQLDVYSAPDAYLQTSGFSVKQMISFLVAKPASSADAEVPLLRAAGQMSSVPFEPGAREMFDYETAVSHIIAGLPAVFLCMYDVQRFGVGVLIDVLRLHPMVLLDGILLPNLHFLAPPDYPKTAPDAVPRYPLARLPTSPMDGDDQWLLLTGAEVRVAELVARGMTNRATAEELIVSPHTVDAHLKHIYEKLGIHSRVELTVLAFRHGSPAA